MTRFRQFLYRLRLAWSLLWCEGYVLARSRRWGDMEYCRINTEASYGLCAYALKSLHVRLTAFDDDYAAEQTLREAKSILSKN